MAILTDRQIWRRDPGPRGQLGNRLGPTERENVRRALVFLRGRYASTDECAAALGITRHALQKGAHRVVRRPTGWPA